MSELSVRCQVNGHDVERRVEARLNLADFLRHDLLLTGTHVGCEHGVCGACTVIVDGRATRSCLMLAAQVDGKSVTTVEGLSQGDELSPLQSAFHRHNAVQCGFCTAGFLMTAHALLTTEAAPSVDRVREVISGNICRCTGYVAIVDAIMDAAREGTTS